jgi:hypothetical protein
MIPPASHAVRVYPGINLGTTIGAILASSAAQSLFDRRTLKDLRKRQAEIEEKLRGSAGTSRQCRDWNKEKRRLSEAIRDKEIADGFTNGSLVPCLEERQGQKICRFVPALDNKRQNRKAEAYSGRVLRAHRRKLNESTERGEKSAPSQRTRRQ